MNSNISIIVKPSFLILLLLLSFSIPSAIADDFVHLELSANKGIVKIGEQVQLSVVGIRSNGTREDVTSGQTGTAYFNLDEELSEITVDGLVTVKDARFYTVGVNAIVGILVVNGSAINIHFIEVAPVDNDGDEIEDNYEIKYGLNPADPSDAPLDLDTDGLSNIDEFGYGTIANNPDTDGDGASDGEEIAHDSSPSNPNEQFGFSEDCTATALNRSIRLSYDGKLRITNIPADQTFFRVRVTCTKGGVTYGGKSEFLSPVPNGTTDIGHISLGVIESPPASISISSSQTTLNANESTQLTVIGTLSDGTTENLTAQSTGTSYTTSNSSIASVSPDGLVTAASSGTAIISARNDGVIGTISITVLGSDDSDGDGMPDDYEIANGLNPNDPNDAGQDPDGDGLTNLQEFQTGTLPQVADTDGDGLNDGDEVTRGTNPLNPDSDGDNLLDGNEVTIGSNPLNPDTDGDGLRDNVEVELGLNPTLTDSDSDGISDFQEDNDGDGLSNGDEIAISTDPNDADTDDDGAPDGLEVTSGCNPLEPEFTTVTGRTIDNQGVISGAEVRIVGRDEPTTISNTQGNFTLTNVRACPPSIQAAADAQVEDMILRGLSDSMSAVLDGISNVGDILLRQLEGPLYPGLKVPVGGGPFSMRMVALNLDGILDFVTTNRGADDISIRLGNGDGTFQPQQRITVGDAPRSVTSSDFNSDGFPDLAVANELADNVVILLGNGDGTLRIGQSLVVGHFEFISPKISSISHL